MSQQGGVHPHIYSHTRGISASYTKLQKEQIHLIYYDIKL